MFEMVLNMPLNEPGKKGTTIFQAGNYAYHMLIFFTDSRLDMLISVMLIKKHVQVFSQCRKMALPYNLAENSNSEFYNFEIKLSKKNFFLLFFCLQTRLQLNRITNRKAIKSSFSRFLLLLCSPECQNSECIYEP